MYKILLNSKEQELKDIKKCLRDYYKVKKFIQAKTAEQSYRRITEIEKHTENAKRIVINLYALLSIKIYDYSHALNSLTSGVNQQSGSFIQIVTEVNLVWFYYKMDRFQDCILACKKVTVVLENEFSSIQKDEKFSFVITYVKLQLVFCYFLLVLEYCHKNNLKQVYIILTNIQKMGIMEAKGLKFIFKEIKILIKADNQIHNSEWISTLELDNVKLIQKEDVDTVKADFQKRIKEVLEELFFVDGENILKYHKHQVLQIGTNQKKKNVLKEKNIWNPIYAYKLYQTTANKKKENTSLTKQKSVNKLNGSREIERKIAITLNPIYLESHNPWTIFKEDTIEFKIKTIAKYNEGQHQVRYSLKDLLSSWQKDEKKGPLKNSVFNELVKSDLLKKQELFTHISGLKVKDSTSNGPIQKYSTTKSERSEAKPIPKESKEYATNTLAKQVKPIDQATNTPPVDYSIPAFGNMQYVNPNGYNVQQTHHQRLTKAMGEAFEEENPKKGQYTIFNSKKFDKFVKTEFKQVQLENIHDEDYITNIKASNPNAKSHTSPKRNTQKTQDDPKDNILPQNSLKRILRTRLCSRSPENQLQRNTMHMQGTSPNRRCCHPTSASTHKIKIRMVDKNNRRRQKLDEQYIAQPILKTDLANNIEYQPHAFQTINPQTYRSTNQRQDNNIEYHPYQTMSPHTYRQQRQDNNIELQSHAFQTMNPHYRQSNQRQEIGYTQNYYSNQFMRTPPKVVFAQEDVDRSNVGDQKTHRLQRNKTIEEKILPMQQIKKVVYREMPTQTDKKQPVIQKVVTKQEPVAVQIQTSFNQQIKDSQSMQLHSSQTKYNSISEVNLLEGLPLSVIIEELRYKEKKLQTELKNIAAKAGKTEQPKFSNNVYKYQPKIEEYLSTNLSQVQEIRLKKKYAFYHPRIGGDNCNEILQLLIYQTRELEEWKKQLVVFFVCVLKKVYQHYYFKEYCDENDIFDIDKISPYVKEMYRKEKEQGVSLRIIEKLLETFAGWLKKMNFKFEANKA